MNAALIAARANVELYVELSSAPLLRRSHLRLAVLLAEYAESIGDEYDTRMLAKVLTVALKHAADRDDREAVDLYAATLLAVLSDLADGGDEHQAEGVNVCAANLPAYLVQLGRACAAARREAAHV
jgi:hypothetical protein